MWPGVGAGPAVQAGGDGCQWRTGRTRPLPEVRTARRVARAFLPVPFLRLHSLLRYRFSRIGLASSETRVLEDVLVPALLPYVCLCERKSTKLTRPLAVLPSPPFPRAAPPAPLPRAPPPLLPKGPEGQRPRAPLQLHHPREGTQARASLAVPF